MPSSTAVASADSRAKAWAEFERLVGEIEETAGLSVGFDALRAGLMEQFIHDWHYVNNLTAYARRVLQSEKERKASP